MTAGDSSGDEQGMADLLGDNSDDDSVHGGVLQKSGSMSSLRSETPKKPAASVSLSSVGSGSSKSSGYTNKRGGWLEWRLAYNFEQLCFEVC